MIFMIDETQWQLIGVASLQIAVSFVFFRLLQYVVRWYLFGKCYFPTFGHYFSTFIGNASTRANAPIDDDEEDDDDIESGPITTNGVDGKVTTIVSPPPIPLSPHKKWRICNEAVSLIHSIISGTWAVYSCVVCPELLLDMMSFTHALPTYLILLSTGYLLHDLVDLLLNERSMRILELLFHHIVVLTAFFTTLTSHLFLGVVICGLLMEVNSMFLHSRSLLNIHHVSKSTITYRCISITNLFTLFTFRLAVSAYLMVWQVRNCWSLEWHFVLVTFVVIASLCVTNTVLAYRVLAADGYFGKRRTRMATRPPATIIAQRQQSPAVTECSLKTGSNALLPVVTIDE